MTRSNWKPITQPIAAHKSAGSPHSKRKTANDPVGPTASQQNWVGREASRVCHRSSTPSPPSHPRPKELFQAWGSGIHGSSPAPKPPQSRRHAGASGRTAGCVCVAGVVRFLHRAQQAEQLALPGCQLPRKPHTCYTRAVGRTAQSHSHRCAECSPLYPLRPRWGPKCGAPKQDLGTLAQGILEGATRHTSLSLSCTRPVRERPPGLSPSPEGPAAWLLGAALGLALHRMQNTLTATAAPPAPFPYSPPGASPSRSPTGT